MGPGMINLRDLALHVALKKSIILAMPSMGEHSVSARIGKNSRKLDYYFD